MQYLWTLLLHCIVWASYKTTATPLAIAADAEEPSTQPTPTYYDGYPQRDQLELYSLYLLSRLRANRDITSINMALWNQTFRNEQEAKKGVEDYLLEQQLTWSQEVTVGCQANYKYDYNKYRFPSTLIAVDCNSTKLYCVTAHGEPGGDCLGDKFFLTTLLFEPDQTAPAVPEQQDTGGQVFIDEASGDSPNEDIPGRWTFRNTLVNKGCLCLP